MNTWDQEAEQLLKHIDNAMREPGFSKLACEDIRAFRMQEAAPQLTALLRRALQEKNKLWHCPECQQVVSTHSKTCPAGPT